VHRWFPSDDPKLTSALSDVRRVGYALVRDEFEPGVVGCSAPVRVGDGRIVAALNVSAPAERLDRRLDEAGRLTVQAAGEVSRALQRDRD
jgi:DNA-binding IclR family transcriptional regulator